LLKTLLFILIFFSFTASHPFYLSVTELKYDSKEKTLQASVKLFINDFEEALKKIYKKPVDLINYSKNDKEGINDLIKDYIQNHLSVSVNSKKQTFNLLGFEREAEAIWVYLEAKNCPSPKKVDVQTTLLYDFIKTQINIVSCGVNSISKSSKVTNPEKKISFQF